MKDDNDPSKESIEDKGEEQPGSEIESLAVRMMKRKEQQQLSTLRPVVFPEVESSLERIRKQLGIIQEPLPKPLATDGIESPFEQMRKQLNATKKSYQTPATIPKFESISEQLRKQLNATQQSYQTPATIPKFESISEQLRKQLNATQQSYQTPATIPKFESISEQLRKQLNATKKSYQTPATIPKFESISEQLRKQLNATKKSYQTPATIPKFESISEQLRKQRGIDYDAIFRLGAIPKGESLSERLIKQFGANQDSIFKLDTIPVGKSISQRLRKQLGIDYDTIFSDAIPGGESLSERLRKQLGIDHEAIISASTLSEDISPFEQIKKQVDELQNINPEGLSDEKVESLFEDVGQQIEHNQQTQVDSLIPSLMQSASLPFEFAIDSGCSPEVASQVSGYLSNIQNNGVGNVDHANLSVSAKGIILYIYYSYIVPLVVYIVQMIHFEQSLKSQMRSTTTPREIKSAIRRHTHTLDTLFVEGMRVTLTPLELRVKPNQKAATIEELEPGKLLQGFPEQGLNKAWLKVEVDMAGERVTGYVLRRYTTPLKR